MTVTEKLTKLQDLLVEFELLYYTPGGPATGLDISSLQELMDDINLRLNSDTFDD